MVPAATEVEVFVAQLLPEFTVHQHVDVLQQLCLTGIAQQRLEGVSGVAPDVFPASLLDGVRQFGEAFRLEHRVAPAERHVCECIGKHLLQNFIGAHPASAVNVPRLRIVAARTPVGASGRVNGGTETGTVHRGIF